jgi:hypothetical protein
MQCQSSLELSALSQLDVPDDYRPADCGLAGGLLHPVPRVPALPYRRRDEVEVAPITRLPPTPREIR